MAHTGEKVLAAFTVDHVASITGLSKVRLTRWDKLGFFPPAFLGDDDPRNPYARVYSFVDMVGLRTLKILADDYGVPLRELRKAADGLKKSSDRPWSAIPLAVLKRRIVFNLDTKPRNVTGGQYTLKHIPLQPIVQEVRERAEKLRHRKVSQHGSTERRKFVQHNAEVISGTRIPVAAIDGFIRAGYSDQEILNEFPTLVVRGIEAVRQRLKVAA